MAHAIEPPGDLMRQAHLQFPDTFQVIGDPACFVFRFETFGNENTSEFLELGVYDLHRNTKDRKTLYARIGVTTIELFYDKSEKLHKVEGGLLNLYPDTGPTRFRNPKAPFDLAAPQNWSTNVKEKASARSSTREHLTSLVKFAFLLTGRTPRPTRQTMNELLQELRHLCENLQRNQREDGTTSSNVPRNFAGVQSQDLPQRLVSEAEGDSSTSHSRNQRGAKRLADTMEDVSVDRDDSRSRRRLKDTSLTLLPRNDTDSPGSVRPSPQQPSEPLKMFEDVCQQLKAKADEAWDAERKMMKEQDAAVRAQLDDERIQTQIGWAREEHLSNKIVALRAQLDDERIQTQIGWAREEHLSDQIVALRAQLDDERIQTQIGRAREEDLSDQIVALRAQLDKDRTQIQEEWAQSEGFRAQIVFLQHQLIKERARA